MCIGCSLGCGIKVLTSDNHLVRIEGDWEAPVNEGLLCKTGRFLPLDDQRQRILSPLVRKNGKLVPETWDKTLEMTAEQLKPLIRKDEKDVDGVAAIASTRLPVEALWVFNEIFAVNLGSSMVTSTEEGKFTSMQKEFAKYSGKQLEERIEIIHDADCVILINSDLQIDHEVISFFFKRNIPKGLKLVLIDPNKNPLADFAAHKLCPANGSISDVLKCLSAAMVETGSVKSNQYDQPKDMLANLSAQVGIEADTFYDAANTIAAALNPIIIYKAASGEDNYSDTLIDFALNTKILREDGRG
ncbi:MAG: molybdopterin-dependent oxidoreductase, partial [Anaerolineaceae bacterium]|nr:molybdopterin-dependent oxidoreductase [Anaerolineaceae bacterium]